jgi:iron complex outermembrane receptor protein
MNTGASALRAMLLATVTAASLLSTTGAQAQSVDAGASGSEAIIVTARKRDETLKDVPIAVSVFNAAALERLNANNVESTLGVTPGLYLGGNFLSPSRDYRQLVIRGVGANSPMEPSVATFIDGVYAPALDFDNEFLDIERVEVLKGPQGALFGRNTEGGAVNIVTRKPSLTDMHVEAQAKYSSFNTAQASASVSGPIISDVLAGSISVLMRRGDNFFKQTGTAETPANPFFPGNDPIQRYKGGVRYKTGDGDNQQTVRAKLLYAPTDTFEAILTASGSLWKGQDQAPGPLVSCHCYTINGDQAFENKSKSYGASLTLIKKFEAVDLTVIGGFQQAISSAPFDSDGTDYRVGNFTDFHRRQSSTSVEARLSSKNDGPFNWLGGIYLYRDTSFTDRFFNNNNMDAPNTVQSAQDGLWSQQITDIARKGVAGFGQLTYDIVPELELAVGGRYSYEKADVSALQRFEFPANGVSAYNPSLNYGWSDFVTPVGRKGDWSNFSPQASLRYKVTPDMSVYAAVSKGFKAGSFQTAPVRPSDVTPIDPEKTTNYEVGVKGSFFNGLLNLDADVFYVKIKDQQLSAVVYLAGAAFPTTTINNVASSHSKGFELSADLRPMKNLTINGNVALVDSSFDNYQVLPGRDVNGDGVVNGLDVYDRSGQRFPSTPKWTYNVGATYTVPLESSKLTFEGNFRHVGSSYVGSASTATDPIIPVPSWNRLDASIAWNKGSWTLKAYAQNLTDNYIVLSRYNSFNVRNLGDFIHNRVAAPRVIGGSVTFRY